MPIKRVDRLIKQLESWQTEWISAKEGKIGFFEKPEVFERRLGQVRKTFRRNIILCNPHLKPTTDEVRDDSGLRSNGSRKTSSPFSNY